LSSSCTSSDLELIDDFDSLKPFSDLEYSLSLPLLDLSYFLLPFLAFYAASLSFLLLSYSSLANSKDSIFIWSSGRLLNTSSSILYNVKESIGYPNF